MTDLEELARIEADIQKTGGELAEMIKELTGSETDMEALKEFRRVITDRKLGKRSSGKTPATPENMEKALDGLIRSETEMITLLKRVKQALLDKMFV